MWWIRFTSRYLISKINFREGCIQKKKKCSRRGIWVTMAWKFRFIWACWPVVIWGKPLEASSFLEWHGCFHVPTYEESQVQYGFTFYLWLFYRCRFHLAIEVMLILLLFFNFLLTLRMVLAFSFHQLSWINHVPFKTWEKNLWNLCMCHLTHLECKINGLLIFG